MKDRNRLVLAILLAAAAVGLIVRVATGGMDSPVGGWPAFGSWVAALLTLCIFSFLAGDNPFYKFAEHLFVGVSAAYWMVNGVWTTLVPNLIGKLAPGWTADRFIPGLRAADGTAPGSDLFYLIPLFFGVLLLMRLAPKGQWLSRWSLAFVVGITAGLRLIAYLSSDFVGQVRNTMLPLVVMDGGRTMWLDSFNNIVTVVGVVTGLSYFYFSKEHTGLFGKVTRVGIWTLMITFGAGFGYTVMGRIALLVGRLEFLFVDWLKLAGR